MLEKVEIAIVGAGHVGLAVGMGFVSLGHEVLFTDKDSAVIEAINSGKPLAYEDGIEELMKRYKGRYRALGSVERAVFGSDIVFVTVSTSTLEDGSVDLSHLVDAATQIWEGFGKS